VLFRQNDLRAAKDVLLPFAGVAEPSGELLALLGRTCHALGQYKDALAYYKDCLARFGMNIDLLNDVGACEYQLGNREEALRVWTRSLELAPAQEKLRKFVDSLKK